jgi:uncharacterized membrane protein
MEGQTDRNPGVHDVQTVAELYAKSEDKVGSHQRRIESVTTALGRPRTLYGLLLCMSLWILYNLLARRLAWPSFDPPPFIWLQGIVGLLALLLTCMVLITQQRQGKMAARRTLLDLHVNLLSEQKIAKLIALLEELRRDLPSVGNRSDPLAEAMTRPVDAQAVIEKLDERIEEALSGQPVRHGEDVSATCMAAEVSEVISDAANSGPDKKPAD